MASVAERIREGLQRLIRRFVLRSDSFSSAQVIGLSGRRCPPPFAQLPDEALLAQMALGDEPALAELYDRFGRVAYALAVRVLRDQTLAEDAVQDAFLGAWRTAAAFDPARGTVSTWLMTLVHRRAVDLVRREERRRDGRSRRDAHRFPRDDRRAGGRP